MPYSVSLKIKQKPKTVAFLDVSVVSPTPKPADIFSAAVSPRDLDYEFELLLDGKPLNGLIQEVVFGMDAGMMMPQLLVRLVPMEIDVQIEVDADVKIEQVFGLVAPETPHYVKRVAQPTDELTGKVASLIDAYQRWKPGKSDTVGGKIEALFAEAEPKTSPK